MDDHKTAAALFEKLYAIEESGPGQKPIALDRARDTLEGWMQHGDPDIRKKAGRALTYFETWFSARKWNRSKDDGRFARSTLVGAINELCDAIESMAQRRRQR